MLYSSSTDVSKALTSLGDSNPVGNPLDNLSEDQIKDAIRQADAIINNHLNGRYTVPPEGNIAVYPVRHWSRDLAAYFVILTWYGRQELPQRDPVQIRYDMVMETLEGVRNGTITVPELVPVTSQPEIDNFPVVNPYDLCTTYAPYTERPTRIGKW